MKWQSMESAPKKEAILLACPAYKEGYYQVVAWWEEEFEWEPDYEADGIDDDPGKYRGAWVDGGLDGGECPIEHKPTHWKHLDPAPSQEKKR